MTNSRIYPRDLWERQFARHKARLAEPPCIIDALASIVNKRKNRRRPRNPYLGELEHPK